MSFSCKHDEQLKHILLEAFMTCCVDNRRLPFFAAFISNEDTFLVDNEEPYEGNDGIITGSTRLMLFLEIISFRDLFGVTPIHRRLFAAKRIAYKFLLSQKQHGSSSMVNPQFDVRSMFTQEQITKLETSINDGDIQHDLFCDIEECLKLSFGGMRFASFLLSDECARMRAYMRGTYPYQDASLHCIFKDALDQTSDSYCDARNHLQYIIAYLLCQSENDVLDKNYHNKKEEQHSDENNRVMGAAGGICCAIFIKRDLLPSINEAKELLLQNPMTEMDSVGQALLDSYSSFWECFIAPSGGTLESTPLSNDTQLMLDKVRRSVSLAASPPKNFSSEERRRHIIRSLVLNTDLVKSLQRLGEELIYDYSVNAHAKYKGHTIHELMCSEVNKFEVNLPMKEATAEQKEEDTDTKVYKDIPQLPSGCVSRLLRRLEFPDGLSRHCPEFKPKSNTPVLVDEKADHSQRCNADFAVIFGSNYELKQVETKDEGVDNENSATITQRELRRFASIPLSLRGKQLASKLDADELIPPTLESYANVPAAAERQFQRITDLNRFT